MAVESQSPTTWPSPRLVYSRRYNIGVFGFERLHPFDSRKYGRAWNILRRRFGEKLFRFWVEPPRQASREELLTVHSAAYLDQLRKPKFVAGVLEVPLLGRAPGWVADRCVLRPMRWAVKGTMVAAEEAMEHGLAVNLSGGYHHASPDDGHGFSAYADVALAVHALRSTGRLNETDRVAYVDLDAHQGNGVCRSFVNDNRMFIYDQYNFFNFPMDGRAQRRIDCDVPIAPGCRDVDYLRALQSRLPKFLDSLLRTNGVKLAIYNAGADIYAGDQLGGLNISAAGVHQRDRFVLQELISRRIPTLVVLSGGYSKESFQLVAEMVGYVLQTWGSV